MKYGIQLYSVRDNTPRDMEGTLRAIAEMGYSFVEFAGFFGHSAETIKGWLDQYGLTVSGTHTGWEALRDDFNGTVAYHKTIGCDTIIVPGADLSTAEKLDAFITFMSDAAARLQKEGIERVHLSVGGGAGMGALLSREGAERRLQGMEQKDLLRGLALADEIGGAPHGVG